MDELKRQVELLSPAGSMEALVAAVSNGADAVYMGGATFNARAGATNFAGVELENAIDYCHQRGVKTYITVNTLLKESELSELEAFLSDISTYGADAAIIQDIATLKIARMIAPELPVHASTQMTIQNWGGLDYVEKLGFSRAILSRELSIANIKELKSRGSSVDLEVFAHGALCVCYSGQCLMSSMIGGRSGNRGRCAQPCRLDYALADEDRMQIDTQIPGKYLLSPKDLMSLPYLAQLIGSGVSSIKLEGRMKRPEYVATITKIYRKAIDQIMEKGLDYEVDKEDEYKLEAIFNRGFTSGYLVKNQGLELMNPTRPNNRGVFVGRIEKYDTEKNIMTMKLEREVNVGDGIEIWVKTGGRIGTTVTRMTHIPPQAYIKSAKAGDIVGIEIKGNIKAEDRVFKNFDSKVEEEAKESFARGESRKIPIDFNVRLKAGEPIEIKAIDDKSNTAEVRGGTNAFIADKSPLSPEHLEKYLSRLGNTPFELGNIECDLDGVSMVPVSEINEARRQVLCIIESMRIEKYKRERVEADGSIYAKKKVNKAKKTKLSVKVGDKASCEAAISAGANVVCIGGEAFVTKAKLSILDLEELVEKANKKGVTLLVGTPRIALSGQLDLAMQFIRAAFEAKVHGCLVSNIGLLEFASSLGDWIVVADWTLNVMNSVSADTILKDASSLICSPEMTLEEVTALCTRVGGEAIGVLAQGPMELMISEQCVLGSMLGGKTSTKACSAPCKSGVKLLKDRTDTYFRVLADSDCRMHIFNSVDLCMVEHIKELFDIGLSELWLDLRIADSNDVATITKIYRDMFNLCAEKDFDTDEYLSMRASSRKVLEDMSYGKITKGHFFRGV